MKTYILAILMLFAIPAPKQQVISARRRSSGGGGGIAYVNGATGSRATQVGVNTATATVTGVGTGQEMIAGCTVNTTQTCTVADGQGSYTLVLHKDDTTGATQTAYLYNLLNTTSGTHTVTCTSSASFSTLQCGAMAVSGLSTSSSTDQSNFNVYTFTTTPTSGAVTTLTAAEIVVGWITATDEGTTCAAATNYTTNSNLFVTDTNNVQSCMVYRIVSTTGTYTPGATLGVGGAGPAITGSFK